MTSKQESYCNDLIHFKKMIEFLSDSINQEDILKLADVRDSYFLWLSHIKEDSGFVKYKRFLVAGPTLSHNLKNGGIGVDNLRYQEVKNMLEKEIDSHIIFFENLSNKELYSDKIHIIIDPLVGIYLKNDKAKNYPIGSTSQRKKIIDLLLENNDTDTPVDISNIRNHLNKKITSSFLGKEFIAINKNFRKKVFDCDFIIKIPTGGYYLNRDKFYFTRQ